jgi:hypothetical protein
MIDGFMWCAPVRESPRDGSGRRPGTRRCCPRRLQAPRADRIAGQQHLKLVGREVPAARRDGHAALAGAQFGADDAERQRRRFGLGGGLARCARLGGCCGARSGLARLDLLDLGAQRLKVVGSGIAAQRFLDLGCACFQDLAGVFEVCRRCDGRTLLDGLDGLGQARRLRFEALQAGIEALLVGLVVHGLVAQGHENAEADQPEPHQALHHHGGGRAPGAAGCSWLASRNRRRQRKRLHRLGGGRLVCVVGGHAVAGPLEANLPCAVIRVQFPGRASQREQRIAQGHGAEVQVRRRQRQRIQLDHRVRRLAQAGSRCA